MTGLSPLAHALAQLDHSERSEMGWPGVHLPSRLHAHAGPWTHSWTSRLPHFRNMFWIVVQRTAFMEYSSETNSWAGRERSSFSFFLLFSSPSPFPRLVGRTCRTGPCRTLSDLCFSD